MQSRALLRHCALRPERASAQRPWSPIFRDSSELLDGVTRPVAVLGVDKTMIDVIIDERALCARNRILHRLKLLRNVDAGPLGLNHVDNAAQMPIGPLQPLDDRRVRGVCFVRHAAIKRLRTKMSSIPSGG